MTTQSDLVEARSAFRAFGDRLPPVLRGRRALAVLGLAVVAAGLAWQWTWLTAIGVAPILVALAPCAAMCALGLCMTGRSGGSCHAGEARTEPWAAEPTPQTPHHARVTRAGGS
ncbi:hypothetical protein JYK14_08295 [Siccirubricoccus sp. KC 17139]|uniref:DUF2892 domain-containing protein n=1 Tax=Siccirubricoccus soli TaxID=2899147 RepID=A0ABT1D2M8_9PROT|nr:hypothetical protein [Siccirubricoccus soli]MCO6416166.1 hypothetical protein [Siccirubricoccus soli]MCP2682300.1 hypothetical protein [Siccirubricoccus soli]